MQAAIGPGSVVTVTNLTEFFRDALRSVLADQRLAVEEQTEYYVVNMLTLFARAEHLYESGRLGVEAALVALPMH